MFGLILAGIIAIPPSLMAAAISDPVPVIVDTDSIYLWRTATGGTMRVQWTFPLNATVAHLAVTGRTFKVSVPGIQDEFYDVELPVPGAAKDEDVLDFTLSFNDGTVKTASLGLVRGRSDGDGATTSTRCMMSASDHGWSYATKSFVIPVPEGSEAVTVSGETVETGLDGAAGWLALGPYPHATAVTLAIDGVSKNLVAYGTGMSLILR